LRAAIDPGSGGQIVVVHGPAGMGKSRLLAEALGAGAGVVVGACHAYAAQVPYAVWQPIWQAILGLDPGQPASERQAALRQTVDAWLPGAAARLPLLGPLLGLPIAETELSRSLDPKLRKEATEALLDDLCRRWIALDATPASRRVIVLEDAHWIDPLSLDVLAVLGRLAGSAPLSLILTCRSEHLDVFAPTGLLDLAQTRQIAVSALSRDEVALLVEARAAAGDEQPAAAPSPEQLESLVERTAGNPLYVEELLRYLALPGRPGQAAAAPEEQIPVTLQRLILARVDRLAAQQQDLLRVSSMLDDTIYPPWVCGFYPAVGSLGSTWSQCEDLCQRSFLRPQATAEMKSYGFLHSLTQDALYESLAYATRSRLHEQYAAYLEDSQPEAPAALTYRLAYHYGRSANLAKKRRALRAAGDLARATYANRSAIQYYAMALECDLPPAEQTTVLGLLGDVCEANGDLAEAIARYEEARAIAATEGDRAQEAHCCYRLGALERVRSDFAAAIAWLDRASHLYQMLDDRAGQCLVQTQLGGVYWSQQQLDQAQDILDAAIIQAEQLQDHGLIAEAFANRGNIAYSQGAYSEAQEWYRHSYEHFLSRNNYARATIMASNMAAVAYVQGSYTAARQGFEQLLPIATDIGVKNNIAFLYVHLSTIAYVQGEMDHARSLAAKAAQLYREIGAGRALANALQTLGAVLYGQRALVEAKATLEEALDLARRIVTPDIEVSVLNILGALACRQGAINEAQALLAEGLRLADQIQISWDKTLLLLNLSDVRRSLGDHSGAWDACAQSISLAASIEAAAIIPQGAIRIAQLLLDRDAALAGPAVRLAGAAEALLTSGGGVLEPDEADIHREVISRAGAILAPAALEEARSGGAGLAGADIVALVAAYSPAP
ncbi:MAG TPA: tetratricopeptide repeat protein, partial [Herpetosiphonaceae bacterium]|nr:tetratricopeptide repeat protein [Herpetosiphonaceae bacterium]